MGWREVEGEGLAECGREIRVANGSSAREEGGEMRGSVVTMVGVKVLRRWVGEEGEEAGDGSRLGGDRGKSSSSPESSSKRGGREGDRDGTEEEEEQDWEGEGERYGRRCSSSESNDSSGDDKDLEAPNEVVGSGEPSAPVQQQQQPLFDSSDVEGTGALALYTMVDCGVGGEVTESRVAGRLASLTVIRVLPCVLALPLPFLFLRSSSSRWIRGGIRPKGGLKSSWLGRMGMAGDLWASRSE